MLREYEEKREPLNPDDLNSLIVKIDSSTSKMHELVDALDSRIRETESMLSSLDPLVETVNDQILKGYESKEQQLSREQRDLERIASLTEKFNDDLVRGKMQIDERFKQIKDSLVRKYQGWNPLLVHLFGIFPHTQGELIFAVELNMDIYWPNQKGITL